MNARVILIVVCVIVLAWVAGTSAVYAYRGDWRRLRRFLFMWHRGIYGAPNVLWAALALGALVRVIV